MNTTLKTLAPAGTLPKDAPPGTVAIKLLVNVSDELQEEYVRQNCKLDVPRLGTDRADGPDEVLIVGGGPSLRDNLHHIRNHKSRGHPIWAANGAHDYLIENDIIPDVMLNLDSGEEHIKVLQKPHKDVIYFVASQCHPNVFEALEGYNIRMWHNYNKGTPALLKELGEEGNIFAGGCSVCLKSVNIAAAMKHKVIHLYGVDSSYGKDDEEDHAYVSEFDEAPTEIFTVNAGEKAFRARGWMIQQSQDFQVQYNQCKSFGIKLTAHGEGLIPHLSTLLDHLEKENERCVTS